MTRTVRTHALGQTYRHIQNYIPYTYIDTLASTEMEAKTPFRYAITRAHIYTQALSGRPLTNAHVITFMPAELTCACMRSMPKKHNGAVTIPAEKHAPIPIKARARTGKKLTAHMRTYMCTNHEHTQTRASACKHHTRVNTKACTHKLHKRIHTYTITDSSMHIKEFSNFVSTLRALRLA